jgi:hypothetical protein
MASCILNIFEGYTCFSCAGDERDPKRVRSELAGAVKRCSPS